MVTNDPNLPDDPPTYLVELDARVRDSSPALTIDSCPNDTYHQIQLTTDLGGCFTVTYSMTLEGARELRGQLDAAIQDVEPTE